MVETKQFSSAYAQALTFKNSIFASGLPIDENPKNEMKPIRGFNYSKVTPTPIEEPYIGSLSP